MGTPLACPRITQASLSRVSAGARETDRQRQTETDRDGDGGTETERKRKREEKKKDQGSRCSDLLLTPMAFCTTDDDPSALSRQGFRRFSFRVVSIFRQNGIAHGGQARQGKQGRVAYISCVRGMGYIYMYISIDKVNRLLDRQMEIS